MGGPSLAEATRSSVPAWVSVLENVWMAAAVAAFLAALLTIALVVRFGDWVFVGWSGRACLLAFLLCFAILLAAGVALLISAGLVALEGLARRFGRLPLLLALIAVTAVWLVPMTSMLSISLSSSTYTHPHALSAIGLGILIVAALAAHGRPWGRAEAAILMLTGALLGVAVAWLNLRLLRKAEVELGRHLNIGIVLAAYALAALGIRGAGAARAGRTWTPRGLRRRAVAIVALVALCAIAVVPLYRVARAAAEPPTAPAAKLADVLGNPSTNFAEPSLPDRKRVGNVILISVDTLRADHLGIYGYEKNTSPNIDRFFSRGLVFERAYAQSPWTLPSHASMLTGLYASAHGSVVYPSDTFGFIDGLEPGLTTIAEILAHQGFATAGFTGGVYLTRDYAFDQGFQTFEATETNLMEDTLELALPWLEQARAGNFFLFLHAYDVHRYEPQRTYDDLPEDDYAGPLKQLFLQRPRLLEASIISDGLSDPTPDDIRFVEHLYDTEIRIVDDQLQRLFDTLERLALLESTAVILTSDHGENLWENGDSGHGFNLYDGTLRVPLLIRAPSQPARRLQGFARVIDISPTILELTGLPSAPPMHGRSLLAGVADAATGIRGLVAEADRFGTQACIFDGRYQYVHYGMPSFNVLRPRFVLRTLRALFSRFNHSQELFDLGDGAAGERDILSEDPERAAELRRSLFASVQALRAQQGTGKRPERSLSPELKKRLRSLGYID